MRNDSQRSGDGGVRRGNNGIIPSSLKTLSSYLRIVSSGASNVASTVMSAASAASAMVERDGETNRDQVSWAGFDRLEIERGATRQVLLLGFSYGFQVWDVEAAGNVCNLATRHDGAVSFMQMLPKPVAPTQYQDKFAESRPLMAICADGSFNGDTNVREDLGVPANGTIQQRNGTVNTTCDPTAVWFYSLKSQAYVHLLRFRSAVHLVRCSSRVVAVLQSAQVHCLNPTTLEREYAITTNPVPGGSYGLGDASLGPLAVGSRWIAYSSSQVPASNAGRLLPQHLTSLPSFPCTPSNGSLVAHYAKESSKQLASGIVTLGGMGYKKLSRYCSERLPDGRRIQHGTARCNGHAIANGWYSPDPESVGMVIVRDIVSKNVIAQFRAHKSPISSLCFDPSGVLLVTASVQGNNINVFRIMPGISSDSGSSYAHLYRLQRGLTNAIIRDISFSSDSQWVMISSARGTSHLFAISPSGGVVNFQSSDVFYSARNTGFNLMAKPVLHGPSGSGIQVLTQRSICVSGPPVTLYPVRRIRNGSNGWMNTVGGAAAAATGLSGPISGAIASTFHNLKGNAVSGDSSSPRQTNYLLVFSPSGSVVQYSLHIAPAINGRAQSPALGSNGESNLDCDVIVEAVQKWNVCQKKNLKERRDCVDVYGEDWNADSSKVYPEKMKWVNSSTSDLYGKTAKEKFTAEEKHHMYISEAEMQMHQNNNPLWARPEIYFQSMLIDELDIDEELACKGEIEIERIPIRTLEARSKDLVPVFDYLQTPKLHPTRVSAIINPNTDQFRPRSSNGKVAHRTNSTSLNSVGIIGNEWDNEPGEDSKAAVNMYIPPTVNARLETVNTRDDSVGVVTQASCVNNRDGLEMENQFTKSDDGFDS